MVAPKQKSNNAVASEDDDGEDDGGDSEKEEVENDLYRSSAYSGLGTMLRTLYKDSSI